MIQLVLPGIHWLLMQSVRLSERTNVRRLNLDGSLLARQNALLAERSRLFSALRCWFDSVLESDLGLHVEGLSEERS